MADVNAHPHFFQMSINRQDSTSAEAMAVRYYLESGMTTAFDQPEFYEDVNETGRESALGERAATKIAKRYSKQITAVMDDYSMPLLFYASNNAAPMAGSTITSAALQGYWNGPVASTSAHNVLAFMAQDCGTTADDNDKNMLLKTATVQSVSINVGDSGPIRISADILAGEAIAIGSTPTSVAWARNALFNRQMARLLTSSTLGLVGGTYATADALKVAPSSSNAITRTQLSGTPYDWSYYVRNLTLTFDNGIDVVGSYQCGDVDGDGVGIVSGGGGGRTAAAWANWRRTPTGQTATLSFQLRNVDTSNYDTEALLAEGEDKTRRAFELWIASPVALEADAYPGFRITFPQMIPRSITQSSDGMGTKLVDCVYEAQWNTTDDLGWRVYWVSKLTGCGQA